MPLVLLAGTGWLLWEALHGIGWQRLADLYAHADPRLLLAVFGVNLLRYLIWSTRWWLLLQTVARPPWFPTFEALMASVFVNTVIPAARAFGGLVRARHLARHTQDRIGPLFGTALVDQLAYASVSVVLGAALVPFAWRGGAGGRLGNGVTILVIATVLVVFVLALWRRRQSVATWLERRLPRAAAAIDGTFEAMRATLARPFSWLVLFLGAVLVWASNIATYHLAAVAVGTELSLVAVILAFSIGSLAGSASGTPGGAGATEAAAMLPLLALGVPAQEALPCILLARSAHYLAALTIGGAAALRGWRRPAAARAASPIQ